MNFSRLIRVTHLVVALSVFAFGAVTASVAQAEETKGPFWSIEGARLGAGKTRGIAVKAVTSSKLSFSGIVITCTKLEAKSGLISGSAVGEAGKNSETLRYSECAVTGNGTSCKVEKGEIITKSLKSELVEDAATKKILLVDFLPATGGVVAEMRFEGTCTFNLIKITGADVLATVLTEPGKETVELGGASRGEAKSWLLAVENPQPTAFWLIEKGKGEEVKIDKEEKLEALGEMTTLEDTASVELASGKLWSPLP